MLPLDQRYAYIKEVHKKIGKDFTETCIYAQKLVDSLNIVCDLTVSAST